LQNATTSRAAPVDGHAIGEALVFADFLSPRLADAEHNEWRCAFPKAKAFATLVSLSAIEQQFVVRKILRRPGE
jgi:hypothetical protein